MASGWTSAAMRASRRACCTPRTWTRPWPRSTGAISPRRSRCRSARDESGGPACIGGSAGAASGCVPGAGGRGRRAVEIHAGSGTKYEINDEGLVEVDRFLSMPVAYPANYGSIPRSLAGDGDPLDALVLTRQPLHPGTLVRFRPVAVLRMRDRGEEDAKIVGVPVDAVDPAFAPIRDLRDLAPMERERIEAFFRVYKQLPAGADTVELAGWGDAGEARAIVAAALARYRAK